MTEPRQLGYYVSPSPLSGRRLLWQDGRVAVDGLGWLNSVGVTRVLSDPGLVWLTPELAAWGEGYVRWSSAVGQGLVSRAESRHAEPKHRNWIRALPYGISALGIPACWWVAIALETRPSPAVLVTIGAVCLVPMLWEVARHRSTWSLVALATVALYFVWTIPAIAASRRFAGEVAKGAPTELGWADPGMVFFVLPVMLGVLVPIAVLAVAAWSAVTSRAAGPGTDRL